MSRSQIAIITGGGTGIGRATALELAGSGWKCALVGRRRSKLQEAAEAIRAAHINADLLLIDADIAEAASAIRIVNEVTEWGGVGSGGGGGGRIDALINNAAVLITGRIEHASDEDYRSLFEVNALAPARMVRLVWPMMVNQKEGRIAGRIINVSSMATLDPFPGLGMYGMSKSALEGLTRAINAEGAQAGIIAFNVILGAVETDMLRSFVSEKVLPRNKAREPAAIASVLAAIARGERDAEARHSIVLK